MENERKNIIIRRILYGVIFIASVMILFFIFDHLFMPVYTRQWQKVKVPDITFKNARVAEKQLRKRGLSLVVKDEKYDSEYPPGFILFQNPAPGALVKKGRRIYLTLGKGQQIIAMPELTGIAERDAKFLMAENQLVLQNITYENDSHYPVGVVCRQSVAPGEDIAVGDYVDIVISLGSDPDRVIVPELVGKSRDDAMIIIRRMGLVLGTVEFQGTDKILPNTVLSQSLSAGLQVARNDTITLVLSKLPGNSEENLQW